MLSSRKQHPKYFHQSDRYTSLADAVAVGGWQYGEQSVKPKECLGRDRRRIALVLCFGTVISSMVDLHENIFYQWEKELLDA
jgi:hypothetical protein